MEVGTLNETYNCLGRPLFTQRVERPQPTDAIDSHKYDAPRIDSETRKELIRQGYITEVTGNGRFINVLA